MYTSLLKRQLKRFLKDDTPITPEWKKLLDAINSSYEHYERDHQLGKQSLEISGEELRQLITELEDKQERIGIILEAASDGILVINENNIVELCNTSAAKCLAFENQKELIGQNISNLKLTPLENYNLHKLNTDLEKDTSTDNFSLNTLNPNRLYEVSILHKNGFQISIELSVSLIKLRNKELKVCVLRDITSRKAYEEKIAVRHKLTHLLLESTSMENATNKILSMLCLDLGWELGFFWLNESNTTLKSKYTFASKNEIPWIEFQENLPPPPPDRINMFICETIENSPFGRSIDDYGPRRQKAFEYGFQTYACFPISFEKETFGIIELFSKKNYLRDEKVTKIFQDICYEIGLFMEHRKAQQRELDLQKQLIKTARQAGMTQVATSVLHNVGNTLTTVSTSSSTLEEKLKASEMNNFEKLAGLIQLHKTDLANFITMDEIGKAIPDYLIIVADYWKKEFENYLQELKLIKTSIQHIKKIIRMQQSMNRLVAMKEKVSVNALLKDLISTYTQEFSREKISIQYEFGDIPELTIDQSVFLQIMNNLIENAIDALGLTEPHYRKVKVQTFLENDFVNIEVIDQGCGIEKENILKIFSYGFTTKKDGHGFGLHSSAIQAKEMGGKLTATSKGIDQGTTLRLSLPINPTCNISV